MLGSMFSAVSGLQAHQTKMNVIGNNIANVNTYGFKSSRATFSDVFYQTMSGASSPNGDDGGTNPTQMGYGAKVSSIDVINTRAGSATTDRALDVYINGEGYIPVTGSDGVVKFTRVGVLSFDASGNLVDRNGNSVLGFALDPVTKNPIIGSSSDGVGDVSDLQRISVPVAELEKYTGISIGQNGEITAIREGDPAFTPSPGMGWMDGVPAPNANSLMTGGITLKVTPPTSPATNPYTLSATGTDKSGNLVNFTVTGTGAGVWDTGALTPPTSITLTDPGNAENSITINLTETTFENYLGTFTDTAGTTVAIGRISPGPGEPVKIGQMALAGFINADGLTQNGDGYYINSPNSGDATVTIPGSGGNANFRSGALEMSNVDLSKEFTEMIITQRGFQANTRMITVSDEMLQELVNMKR